MTSGQRIGVIGIGGLGHMAVKFASALGNHVTAFTTSDDKFAEASRYGANEAINVKSTDLTEYDGKPFDILLSTVPVPLELETYINLLSSDGTLSFVGIPDGPMELPLFPMLMKRRRIMASPIGGRRMIKDMLNIAATHNVTPVIEEFEMSELNTALQKVRDNTIRYRAVVKNS